MWTTAPSVNTTSMGCGGTCAAGEKVFLDLGVFVLGVLGVFVLGVWLGGC